MCANTPHSDRPASMYNTTSLTNVELVLCDDRRQLLKHIADNTDINRETVRLIVTKDLGMMKGSAKVVPKNLTSAQKLIRVCIGEDWLKNWTNLMK